jgi:hypothetical protein
MYINKPQDISVTEWQEIMDYPHIQREWMLSNKTIEQFSSMLYAAKFKFTSRDEKSEYSGDVYFIHSSTLGGDFPIVLCRDDEGRLQTVIYED